MSYPAEHRNLTKQKIVRSARQLFNRRGFDTVSIDDVMADAGLTRGSFYSYFESKGDLYAEAVTQILNEMCPEPALSIVAAIMPPICRIFICSPPSREGGRPKHLPGATFGRCCSACIHMRV